MKSTGLYPAGTVMRTHSGHVVLSVSPNPFDTRRPFCRIIARPGGDWDAAAADRWDPMPDDEQVDSILLPEEHGLPIDVMLAA